MPAATALPAVDRPVLAAELACDAPVAIPAWAAASAAARAELADVGVVGDEGVDGVVGALPWLAVA